MHAIITSVRTIAVVSGGLIKNGPQCRCNNRDWFFQGSWATCSSCDRKREATVRGFIVDGPQCQCNGRDWLIGQDGARCTWCDRWR